MSSSSGIPGYGYYRYDPDGTAYVAARGVRATTPYYNASTPPAVAPLTPAPAVSSTLTAAHDFADQGEAAFRAADYAGAAYAWRHAVVDHPDNAVVTLRLGQALFAMARFDEAASVTHEAMRRFPKETWGVVISDDYAELCSNVEDYTRQLRVLEKTINEKPDDPTLRFLVGFHYAHLGYPQQAIGQLNQAVKRAPGDEMAKQLRDELRDKLAKPAIPPVAQVPEA